jgi:hypothetical protein
MARPHGYKRLSFKARHIIRRLRRTRYASVQDMHLHELGREINSRWSGRRKAHTAPDLSDTGVWRPLTYRARRILAELRKTRVWRVQQRLLAELGRELKRGRRSLGRTVRQVRTAGRRRLARLKPVRAVRRLRHRTRSGWKRSGWTPARPPVPRTVAPRTRTAIPPRTPAGRPAPAPRPGGRLAPSPRPAARTRS